VPIVAPAVEPGGEPPARRRPRTELSSSRAPVASRHETVLRRRGSGVPGDGSAPTHAELWSGGILSRLAEPAGTDHSDAYAINAYGRIAGDSVSSTTGSHAIYWDGATGTPRQIGPVKANGIVDSSSATGVDDSGDVVGIPVDNDTSPFGFFSPRGTLRVNAKAGAVTVAFAGRLGTKALKAGTFRLTAVAIDAAGNRSRPLTVNVTVR